jgi:hypothetical protein
LKHLKHHVLAVVVLGALSMQSSWSEESSLASNGTSVVSSAAKPDGRNQGVDAVSSNAIKGKDGSAEGGAGSKGEHSASPPVGGMNAGSKDLSNGKFKEATGNGAHTRTQDTGTGINPIDTRISVQPRRTIKPPDKIGDVKSIARPGVPDNLRARHQNSVPGAIGGITRNAIGLPVGNNPAAQGPNAGRQGSPPGAQISRPNATGDVARSAVGSVTNAGTQVSGPRVAPQNTSPIATVTAINYAAINGTRMVRPGSGPGIVGGPAKNIAGINGTGYRPKH